MIETYQHINRFIPSYFNKRTVKEQVDILQDFIDYMCEQLGISAHYKVVVNNKIGDDQARHSIDDKTISINSKNFNYYRELLDKYNENGGNIPRELIVYPFQLCEMLTHEIRHAYQFEEYKKDPTCYVNIRYPVVNDMLYIFQATEEDAYKFAIEEMNKLSKFFKKYNNMLLADEETIMNEFLEGKYTEYLAEFKSAQTFLEDIGILAPCDEADPYNYRNKLNISALDFLMNRETEFVKDRIDAQVNKNDYITINIELNMSNLLNCKIKNDNGLWNVELILSKPNNVDDNRNRKMNFILDNDTCRLSYLLLKNNETSSIPGDELIKYLNAFISLYPNKIKHMEISDFAYNLDYAETREFIIANVEEEHEDIFLIRSKHFTNKEYNEATKKLENCIDKLPLEDKININKGIHIFPTKKVDIVR